MSFIYLFLLTLQDQLSADMYSYASKEADYARYYVMVSTFTLGNLKKNKVCHNMSSDLSIPASIISCGFAAMLTVIRGPS